MRNNLQWCDDGNAISGDGCSKDCSIENGYTCTGGSNNSKDKCAEICGDGIRMSLAVQCDDGNTINGDGCSSLCMIEKGYRCSSGSAASKDICS